MKILFALLSLLITTSCFAEPEEMIQIYRDYDREKVLRLLEAGKVPHKLVNENQIYYPVSYKEKVEEVTTKVWGPVDDSKKGVTVNSKDASRLAAELVAKGVQFEVMHSDGTSTFTWQTYYNSMAMKVVHEIVP